MSNKKQLLKIINVAKTFNDGVITIHALKDINLEIMQGEVMSLLGVNGAGKTTLSSIIATLNPASAATRAVSIVPSVASVLIAICCRLFRSDILPHFFNCN